MKKVKLTMNEQFKYDVIKKLVETNGNKKRAALKLNCTVRTINRLIIKYHQFGKAGFVHGNHHRKPATTFAPDVKDMIINLYMEEFQDTNFTHFSEIVFKKTGISVSDATINKWLREKHILSPKAHRITKSNEKKILKMEADSSPSEKTKNEIILKISHIDEKMAHPRRPRCKYMGEMIQMDACSKKWLEDQPVWHLHLAIDDASGNVVGAWFDYQETLNGYYHVFEQILINYGIPAMFYTDRRTVFEYRKKNRPMDDDDTFTQFSYACKQLGVEIKTTSVPQAKGRIERLNETFQSRLPAEMRIAQVKNIDEANMFLKSYLKEYNDRFALHLNATSSVFEKQPDEETINKILSVISTRKIDSGHTFRFNKKNYYITNSTGDRIYFAKGTECMIIHCLDGQFYVNVEDSLYLMEEVPEFEKYSKNFDMTEEKSESKKKYIPPLDHPWRKNSWKLFFSSSQKHLYDTHQ